MCSRGGAVLGSVGGEGQRSDLAGDAREPKHELVGGNTLDSLDGHQVSRSGRSLLHTDAYV